MNNLDIIIKKINSFSRKNNYHKRMGSIYYDRLYEEADYICKKLK